jgi:hypothetical protein
LRCARQRQAFDLYDVDGSGEIDEHELLLAFKSLGFDSKPAEVRKMVALYDTDGNGVLDFDEFCELIGPQLRSVLPPMPARASPHGLRTSGEPRAEAEPRWRGSASVGKSPVAPAQHPHTLDRLFSRLLLCLSSATVKKRRRKKLIEASTCSPAELR